MPITKDPIIITSEPTLISAGLDVGKYNAVNNGAPIVIRSTSDDTNPPTEAERQFDENKPIDPGWFVLEVETGVHDWAWTRGPYTSKIVI